MDYLLDEIRDALHRPEKRRKGRRLSVRTEDGAYPILKMWADGLQVAEADAPRLRGFVDIMDQDDRLSRCLIVFAKSEHGVATYEFKRQTADTGAAPLTHAAADDAPVGLLT